MLTYNIAEAKMKGFCYSRPSDKIAYYLFYKNSAVCDSTPSKFQLHSPNQETF